MGLRNGNLSNVSVELPGITLGIRGFFSVNLLINNGMYFSVNLLMTINQSQVTIEPSDEYFLAPNIPLDKLANALYKYANLEPGERVLAFVDQSMFGSGKMGLVFTENRLIYQELWEKPKSLKYSDVRDVASKFPKFYNDKLDSILQNLLPELKQIYQLNTIEVLENNTTDKLVNLDDELIHKIQAMTQICEACISLKPGIKNLNHLLKP